METLLIYLVKSSGLIATFFLAYHFMLRKETFFTSNRWFLLAGLFASVLLPLVVFTKTVWVVSSPVNQNWSSVPLSASPAKETFEINWYLLLGIAYSIGIILLLLKFALDYYNLTKVLKNKTVQKQADFKFLDITDNVAPFSYFDYIVYNSSLYSPAELENILEHEKVHSEQNHTLDVLISRLFCVLFWFNPLIWFYKKAILQNLEFIADSGALKKISDKKAYQITLLKITTQENCVAITNHFYQSLIKKRIVMLNKNQSKKWNSWKYAIVIPVVVAFFIFFQVKVVAQEKISIKKEIRNNQTEPESVVVYTIDKTTTDTELQEKAKILSEKYAIKTTFSKVKRNTNKEIIGLKVKLQKGNEIATVMEVNSTEPIKDFGISISKNNNGSTNIGIITNETGNLTNNIIGYNNNIPSLPTPPTPPSPPDFPNDPMPKMPEIDMSKMPKPPVHPKDINDKKAMLKYKKEMDKFEAKMEAFEPDSKAFEQAMEEEMTKRQATFEKAMKKYEIAMDAKKEAMEARRDAMEARKEVMTEREKE